MKLSSTYFCSQGFQLLVRFYHAYICSNLSIVIPDHFMWMLEFTYVMTAFYICDRICCSALGWDVCIGNHFYLSLPLTHFLLINPLLISIYISYILFIFFLKRLFIDMIRIQGQNIFMCSYFMFCYVWSLTH